MAHTVKAFDERNRSLATVRYPIAGVLVACGYAAWRGNKHKQDAITLHTTKPALIAFIRMMSFKPLPDARAIDSKTFIDLGGAKGYAHIRNHVYAPSTRDDTV